MSIKISNFKLGIGIPVTWTHVPTPFFDSFIQAEKPDFIYIPAKNGPVDELRNYIVEIAMASACSHLLMIDVDETFPIDMIPKLLSHKLPVVHGVVPRRYPPFDNILLRGEVNKYKQDENYKDGELVEVDAIGTGCVLYSMEVFYKTSPPWFEFTPNPDPELGGVVGEDIGFCGKLKKAGFRIFADTSVKIGHLITFTVDENFAALYRALNKRQEELNKLKEKE